MKPATKVRKKHIKLLFFVAATVWVILWAALFLPIFLKFIANNPNFVGQFTIPVAFAIKWFGYWISLFILGWLLTGKHAIRFSLGTLFFLSIFVILSPPMCISINGNLLVEDGNYSCMMGDDAVISWIFHFIVPYGHWLLYYLTYVVGTITFVLLTILTFNKKDMWKAVVEKFNGGKK
jgi:hypothetical protein